VASRAGFEKRGDLGVAHPIKVIGHFDLTLHETKSPRLGASSGS
jgi:hypothetical protein